MTFNSMEDLAKGLQHSNNQEVSDLAKAHLALVASYKELHHQYVMKCAEDVMLKHEKLFKKLAENCD